MKITLGIDGGGTRTRLLIQRDDDEPQYESRAVSIKVRNGDFAASASELLRILLEILGDDLPHIHAIAIGLAGMSRAEDQQSLNHAIHSLSELAHTKLHIETDATLTLSALLVEGDPGILLIAGTGSVIFYQPKDGPARRIGGWGPILSDEGSGYRIGLRALRSYVHVLDGLARPDAIIEAISNRLPPEVREDRIALSRLVEQNPAFVASLARDVMDATMQPETDKDVLMEELIELILMLEPVMTEEVMRCPPPYRLFLCGSVAKHPALSIGLNMGMDSDLATHHPVDDRVPCMKALEIARSL